MVSLQEHLAKVPTTFEAPNSKVGDLVKDIAKANGHTLWQSNSASVVNKVVKDFKEEKKRGLW